MEEEQMNYVPPAKEKKPFKVVAIILGVLVFGLAGLSAALLIRDYDCSKEDVCEEEDSGEDVALLEAEKDLAVREVIGSIKKDADAFMEGRSFITTYSNSSGPVYRPSDAKTGLQLDKSYGLYLLLMANSSEYMQEDEDKLLSEELQDVIVGSFTKLGFREYDDVPLNGVMQYVDNDSGIICMYLGRSIPFEVSCGDFSWISAEKIGFSNKLAEAYKTAKGEYPAMISADEDEIVDSSQAPYQRIMASTGNAAGLFYRVSADDDWVFIGESQQALDCDEYDTEDARKAFAGEPCIDASGNQAEVTP